MKIQCDVCEKSPATVICCADEAALCAECDVQVHAANKLASKHQRLLLQCLSHNLHPCDICQEKAAFIFCVEDRALLCKDCDAPLHSANTLAANHQRYLATGIRVALSSTCDKDTSKPQMELRPPGSNSHIKTHSSCTTSTSWAVDDLLHFSDHESPHKKQQLEFGELEWLTDMNLFSSAAAEVPELPVSQPSNINAHRPSKLHTAHNKPRIESPDDEDENYTVPDLG